MAFNLFKKKKDKEENKNMSNHYYNLKVRDIVKETEDAISIYFNNPSERLKYNSGQFLTLIAEINGQKVRRAYSLCTSEMVDEYPAVTVKRVEGGLMSNYLNNHLKVGDTVEIMEPMGTFTTEYQTDNKRHFILFGGGSGITPMMSIIKSTMHAEPNSVASLIYANRNENTIIFKDQFEALKEKYPDRLRVVHVLDNAPLQWQGPSGLLNPGMLKNIFKGIPDWGVENTTYLMCGPEGMMNNVTEILNELQVPQASIFKESFVTGTTHKKDAGSDEVTSQTVTILYDGEEFEVEVSPDTTILEAALDGGHDLPYSCQSGLCTACRGKCLSGKVKMDEDEGLSESELDDGYVLPCVGHPLTGDVKIEIG